MVIIYAASSNWWLRSPNTGNTNNFWNVNTGGNTNNNNNANNSNGVCPGFTCFKVTTNKGEDNSVREQRELHVKEIMAICVRTQRI